MKVRDADVLEEAAYRLASIVSPGVHERELQVIINLLTTLRDAVLDDIEEQQQAL
jgi:hypothetical protein